MRVCIVGAGAAGLCAARHVLAQTGWPHPVVYEQTGQLGGTWFYRDDTGLDEHGLPIHSSMYRDMKTNLPKEVMGFPDYPFWTEGPSFISHQQVLRYLRMYANHYKVDSVIKYNTLVSEVRRLEDDQTVSSSNYPKWKVCVKSLMDGSLSYAIFDAIFVCNGHYFKPYMPEMSGIDSFKGQIMHSHNYRKPDDFAGTSVACLGAGPSGTDIALELATVCRKVYLCHNKRPLCTSLPSNLKQAAGISELRPDSAVLTDGSVISIDALILCTGYEFEFPFLDNSDPDFGVHLTEHGRRVVPLYQHILHPEIHNMFFIGLPKTIVPFPVFDTQIRYCLSILSGNASLPSEKEMYNWIEEDVKELTISRSLPAHKAHTLSRLQWSYMAKLTKLGNIPHLITPAIQRLYDHVHDVRVKDLPGYKKVNYRLKSDTEFE